MSNSKANRVMADAARRKALDEAFNEAMDSVSDESVFSADQIYALQRMLQLLRAIYVK